jgi:hypothetical protein
MDFEAIFKDADRRASMRIKEVAERKPIPTECLCLVGVLVSVKKCKQTTVGKPNMSVLFKLGSFANIPTRVEKATTTDPATGAPKTEEVIRSRVDPKDPHRLLVLPRVKGSKPGMAPWVPPKVGEIALREGELLQLFAPSAPEGNCKGVPAYFIDVRIKVGPSKPPQARADGSMPHYHEYFGGADGKATPGGQLSFTCSDVIPISTPDGVTSIPYVMALGAVPGHCSEVATFEAAKTSSQLDVVMRSGPDRIAFAKSQAAKPLGSVKVLTRVDIQERTGQQFDKGPFVCGGKNGGPEKPCIKAVATISEIPPDMSYIDAVSSDSLPKVTVAMISYSESIEAAFGIPCTELWCPFAKSLITAAPLHFDAEIDEKKTEGFSASAAAGDTMRIAVASLNADVFRALATAALPVTPKVATSLVTKKLPDGVKMIDDAIHVDGIAEQDYVDRVCGKAPAPQCVGKKPIVCVSATNVVTGDRASGKVQFRAQSELQKDHVDEIAKCAKEGYVLFALVSCVEPSVIQRLVNDSKKLDAPIDPAMALRNSKALFLGGGTAFADNLIFFDGAKLALPSAPVKYNHEDGDTRVCIYAVRHDIAKVMFEKHGQVPTALAINGSMLSLPDLDIVANGTAYEPNGKPIGLGKTPAPSGSAASTPPGTPLKNPQQHQSGAASPSQLSASAAIVAAHSDDVFPDTDAPMDLVFASTDVSTAPAAPTAPAAAAATATATAVAAAAPAPAHVRHKQQMAKDDAGDKSDHEKVPGTKKKVVYKKPDSQ